MTPNSPTAASFKCVFSYDAQGLRTQKDVYAYTGGAWVFSYTRKWVYDGTTPVAEFDGSSQLRETFAWGQDGNLLAVTDYSSPAAPHVYMAVTDGLGNVTELNYRTQSHGVVASDSEGGKTQYLTDGGFFDNLGIRRFVHLLEETDQTPEDLSLVFLSNAGAAFDWDASELRPSLVRTAIRSVDVSMNRLAQMDPEAIGYPRKEPRKSIFAGRYAMIDIRKKVARGEDPYALDTSIQHGVKLIRTSEPI